MKAKICFNNEIHRISNLPEALSGLKDVVSTLFKATLPQSWTLQYIDCEGDKIVIGNEHDYAEMKNWGMQGNQASSIIKIFVESSQFGNLSEIKKEEVLSAESVSSQEEDYLVIGGEEQEAPKADLSRSLSESVSSKEEVVAPVKEEVVQKEEKPVKEEASEESPIQHVGEGKVLVDLAVLEKMMENMLQKSLPAVVEVTKESLLKEKKEDEAKKSYVRKVVHYGVSCSGCGVIPIVGTRYKCSVCPCFDFCEDCEDSRKHMHNFIKMKERDVFDMFRPNTGFNNNNNKPKEHPHHHKKYQPENWPHNNNNAQKKPIGDSNNPRFRAVKGKADKLKQRFPHADFEILLAYVSGCPDDFTMDELIENYKI